MQLIILTHADEPYMSELRRAGYRGPILEYIAANEAEGPGPYPNARAACDRNYPTYQRTVADRVGVFCRSIHPHESWFLHNLNGARLWSRYQSGDGVWRTTYLMNPASPGWRGFLIHRLRQYRQLGWDGFFLDNVDLSRAGLLRQPASRGGVAEFATDAAYRAAEIAYLHALRAAFPGVPLWANLTHDPETVGGWSPYLAFLDGVMVENFALGWKSSPLPPAARIAQFENVRHALARGKGVILVVQGGAAPTPAHHARLRFGLACYWALSPPPSPLTRRPSGLYFRYADAFDQDYRAFHWHAAYAFQPPAAAGRLEGAGAVWQRRFRGGALHLDLARAAATWPPPWNHFH